MRLKSFVKNKGLKILSFIKIHIDNKRRLLLLLFFFLIQIGIGFFWKQSFNLRKRAAIVLPITVPPNMQRGHANDLVADTILGQPDFSEINQGRVVPNKLFRSSGVVVDTNSKPNKIYVYDGNNSRILGFSSLGICENNSQRKCTNNSDCENGGICQIEETAEPDLVIGQPSLWDNSACNWDSSFQHYPNRAPASALTLCGIPENQNSTTEGGSSASMAVDKDGNLYVPDFWNNRVLRFNQPFATDTSADYVWGQDDFTGNQCNKNRGNRGLGSGPPDNSTLCLTSQYNWGFTAGVDIDKEGNLWVADNANNRVLRFPINPDTKIPQKQADLVFGQNSFNQVTWPENSWTERNLNKRSMPPLNQTFAPAAVRVSSQGWVYVADSLNSRLLIFKPPFTNGMAANEAFGKRYLPNNSYVWSQTVFNYPTDIEFAVNGEGIWVQDTDNQMIELWENNGQQVIKVLFKDTYRPNGQYEPGNCPKEISGKNYCGLKDATGSFGIDDMGNIYSNSIYSADGSSSYLNRYDSPIPTPVVGRSYPASASFFRGSPGWNLSNDIDLVSPRGVAIYKDQLIVADKQRVLFWNDLKSFQSGQAPSGSLAGDIKIENAVHYGRVKADQKGHLWIAHLYQIEVYALPLVGGDKPIKIINNPLNLIDGGKISWSLGNNSLNLGIIYPTLDGKFVWITDSENSRVMRLRDPLTNRAVVDVIIGQPDAVANGCNRGQGEGKGMTRNSLCYPGAVALDKYGNLYVGDSSLEDRGNNRILRYSVNNIPTNNNSLLVDIEAEAVYPYTAFEMAFDSQNNMVIGNNGYRTNFPKIIRDPINNTKASESLSDYFSGSYALEFDEENNLYVSDDSRARVLIYKNPFNSPIVIPSPFPTDIIPTETLSHPNFEFSPDTVLSCQPNLTPIPKEVYSGQGLTYQPGLTAPEGGVNIENYYSMTNKPDINSQTKCNDPDRTGCFINSVSGWNDSVSFWTNLSIQIRGNTYICQGNNSQWNPAPPPDLPQNSCQNNCQESVEIIGGVVSLFNEGTSPPGKYCHYDIYLDWNANVTNPVVTFENSFEKIERDWLGDKISNWKQKTVPAKTLSGQQTTFRMYQNNKLIETPQTFNCMDGPAALDTKPPNSPTLYSRYYPEPHSNNPADVIVWRWQWTSDQTCEDCEEPVGQCLANGKSDGETKIDCYLDYQSPYIWQLTDLTSDQKLFWYQNNWNKQVTKLDGSNYLPTETEYVFDCSQRGEHKIRFELAARDARGNYTSRCYDTGRPKDFEDCYIDYQVVDEIDCPR